MNQINRRSFLASTGAALAGSAALARANASAGVSSAPLWQRARDDHPGDDHQGPCAIAAGNGMEATAKAMAMIAAGADPVDAIVAGVTLVENDPNDMSVGLGGLPNELGVVQLDASVMHGPTHKAGAVGAIENIKNPAQVALRVLKRTDHAMLVGEGAKRFAIAQGFKEENLLTDRARRVWMKWKENLNPNDDWLDWEQMDFDPKDQAMVDLHALRFTYGTIHCSAVNGDGDLAGVTTTSGLSFKIPGRVGDSPIIGAGMFTDNAVGSAGATGRGEAVIHNCGAFNVVEHMGRGLTPTEACLAVLQRIADRTRQKRLLDADGKPNFNVALYAVRKDGAFGSAALRRGATFTVNTGTDQSTRYKCPSLL